MVGATMKLVTRGRLARFNKILVANNDKKIEGHRGAYEKAKKRLAGEKKKRRKKSNRKTFCCPKRLIYRPRKPPHSILSKRNWKLWVLR